jgi:hypothetical protein
LQILMRTSSGVEAYVAGREWQGAKLPRCPLHPCGGCGIARHGSYARAKPSGVRVARWYCPQGHRTFSLLPDFLAARLPGLLVEVEEAIIVAARSPSIEAAAASMRGLEVSLPAAIRWLRRRLGPVQRAVQVLRDTDPEMAVVAGDGDLTRLRLHLNDEVLARLPPPLGFGVCGHRRPAPEGRQHKMWPDTHGPTIYSGGEHAPLSVFLWLRDPVRSRTPNARPPPGTSSAYGAQTAVSVRVPRGNTCIGYGGSDAIATHSALTKPTN